MPTLVELESQEPTGETAEETQINWIARELLDNDSVHSNDTTVTRSILIEEALNSPVEAVKSPVQVQPRKPLRRVPQNMVGPNEKLYRSRYESKVKRIIRENKGKSYKDMNEDEKKRMQSKVAQLLSKLSISKGTNDDVPLTFDGGDSVIQDESTFISHVMDDDVTLDSLEPPNIASRMLLSPAASRQSNIETPKTTNKSTRKKEKGGSSGLFSPPNPPNLNQDCSRDPFFSPAACDDASVLNETHDSRTSLSLRESNNHDQSRNLLSPHYEPPSRKDQSRVLFSPGDSVSKAASPLSDESTVSFREPPLAHDSVDDSSVEVPRSLKTPAASGASWRKRLATTSGKRGSDTFRFKGQQSPAISQSRVFELDDTLDESLPAPADDAFTASLSPIVIDETRGLSPDPMFPFEDDSDDSTTMNDSIEFTMPIATNKKNSSNSFVLKPGQGARYKPLQFQSTKAKGSSQKPVDPFRNYPKDIVRRLNNMIEKIRRRDRENLPSLILSPSFDHFVGVACKLIIQDFDGQLVKSSDTRTRSLVVLRDKEELASFTRMLREKTPFSVLDHSALTASERRSPSTVDKCESVDVVLTTYDALKSNDMTVNLTKDGFVDTESQSRTSGGWLDGRESSQKGQERRLLSVLHLIHWNRLFVVDECGRKSYLAKSDTARWNAVKVLSTDHRLFYVSASDEQSCYVTTLLKSDRRANEAFEALLCPKGMNEDDFVLHDFIVDH